MEALGSLVMYILFSVMAVLGFMSMMTLFFAVWLKKQFIKAPIKSA